jgi:predicted nucleotide-binding protein (sugar kinase/HSP70/actin superfamily)
MKKLHERYPGVNIHTIEYDYDSAPALRESRILLGIGEGRENVKED